MKLLKGAKLKLKAQIPRGRPPIRNSHLLGCLICGSYRYVRRAPEPPNHVKEFADSDDLGPNKARCSPISSLKRENQFRRHPPPRNGFCRCRERNPRACARLEGRAACVRVDPSRPSPQRASASRDNGEAVAREGRRSILQRRHSPR